MTSRVRLLRNLGAALTLLSLGSASNLAIAGDKTWDGFANSNWDTSSLNFGGTAWNNASGDGAIFSGTGLGVVNLPGSINLDSLNITANGYTFNGTGPLNFVTGSSTLSTGVINVASGTTQINVPITSTQTAIQKIGTGVLELTQPVNVTASFPINTNINGVLGANVIIGPAPTGTSPVGGTIKLANASVLPTNVSVAIGAASYLDIGSNNVTLGQLIYQNQYVSSTWPSNGVIGTGTLKVDGEINVIGVFGDNFSNTIATNLDLGGKNQIIRASSGSSIAGASAMVISGVISNGSLTKTLGYNVNGVYGSGIGEGVALLGNNTYTGETVHNSGSFGSVATGTNASQSLKIVNGGFTLQGVDGSFGSASSIKVFSSGTLVLDNNAVFGSASTPGVGVPFIAAANNGNRIPDNVTIEVRDSAVTFRGLSNAASSETYGGLNLTGGFNTLTIAPTGTGTATFSATGDLTMNSRATLQISAASTVLGTTGFAKFAGSVPAPSGGIIPRIVSTSDFVTYDVTNGFIPLSAGSYSATYAANANVTRSTAGNVGTLSINALRSTASNTTTIDAGSTLNVATGMIFSSSGTNTIASGGAGATLDFAGAPGTFFGTNIVQTAVTGSQGILNSGTLTLTGDLSGLSGTLSHLSTGTLNMNTNTFTGPIEVRRGALSIGVNTFNSSSGITLGVASNDIDLIPANPSLSTSAAGAGATISVPILVDNGATNAKGLTLNRQGYITSLSPLSNNTGSQTISSNITLNTSLNFQGGGGGGTGSTNFSGNITGNGTLVIPNGRANFSGTYTNAGGMIIGTGGNTAIITFSGTGGNGKLVLNGGSTSTTSIAYSTAANLYSGSITVQNSVGNNAFTINNLGNSTINNTVNLNGDVFSSVPTGITATWAGTLNGNGRLTKTNPGTLVLSNNSNTYTGPVTVNAGTLAVNGNLASSTNAVTVNNTGRLGGSGTIARSVTVNSGGTLAPGNSPGMLTIDGNLTLASGSTFSVELNGSAIGSGYDNVTVNGAGRSVTITGSALSATTTLSPMNASDLMFVMILSDSSSILTGNFAGIAQDGLVNILGAGSELYSAQVSYTGDSSTNALTGGNDIVLYNFAAVPEPTTIAFFGVLGAGAAGGWYYRRQRMNKQLDAKLKRA